MKIGIYYLLLTVLFNYSSLGQTVKDSLSAPQIKRISLGKTDYSISDSVYIEDGKDEKVLVFFTGMVPVDIWDKLMLKREEKYAFASVVSRLSLEAQYTLKNTLSFIPLKKQFFWWDKKANLFICNYEMTGRNGYGNLTETTSLVKYDPFKK